jgi:MGT family glycosyltransferase
MKPKRILFANFPADGHFNPLTGLAVHLLELGHDVRWYAGRKYAEKIERMGIGYYPFKKAVDPSLSGFEEAFPERTRLKSQISKLKFDLKHAFILRSPEFYEDLKEIYQTFPFDLLIADIAFTGIPFVKEKLNVPVIAVGVLPLAETSKDLPPSGLGQTPSYTPWGRKKQALSRLIADKLIFSGPDRLLRKIFREHGIRNEEGNLFDVLYRKSNLVLQSGTPGFEYYRSDLSSNIRFIGPLLPYSNKPRQTFRYLDQARKYGKTILVTQGTVERDPEKLLVPTLEAFKDTDTLVIATTGGSQTRELRARFPQANLIIEDFIPFDEVMPYTDVYITNGGYGGVMLGIRHKLPLVVAGIHEGKNEINARVGYFKLGINLNTEYPKVEQMRHSVFEIMRNPMYKSRVTQLSEEFDQYDPRLLCEKYVMEVLKEEIDADDFLERQGVLRLLQQSLPA